MSISVANLSGNRISASFLMLLVFAFFRPLSISIHHIGSVNLLDIFGIASSYLLLIALLIHIRYLELKAINILVFFFICFCIISLALGSDQREMLRLTLPFIPFFAAQVLIKSEKHLRIILAFIILGYVVPIVGSSITILFGISSFEVDYYTNISRYYGLSSGSHALAHMMLFFSFVVGLRIIDYENEKAAFTFSLVLLFFSSVYCLAMTNTRTGYFGFLIFWSFILWSWKKKYFIFLLLSLLIVSATFSEKVGKIMMRAQEGEVKTTGINYISSGRISLWDHNIDLFKTLPLETKLIGIGLGNEQKPVISSDTQGSAVSSHNDYLSLLMCSGIIGLTIYCLIQVTFLVNILRSEMSTNFKYFFIGFLCTVVAMNFVSNSYINRFPLAQLFWFFVGIFYAFPNFVGKNEKI